MVKFPKIEIIFEVQSMLPPEYLEVLRNLHSKLKGTTVSWAITGSVSFCLQGVDVSPDDVDIQTDEAGAYEMERLFRGSVIKEVEFSSTERIKSYFGALKVEGVLVEIMGAVQKFYGGEWEEPVDINSHKKVVTVEEMEIPVMNLGYEAEAYRKLGRRDMAEKLRNYADSQVQDN